MSDAADRWVGAPRGRMPAVEIFDALGERGADHELYRAVVAIAAEQQLDAIGVAAAEPFDDTLTQLRTRRAAGLSADMAFTYRNPERSADPTRALDGARRIVVAARSYHREPAPAPEGLGPVGTVARYVWEDHYAALRDGLDAVARVLRDAGHRTRVLVDDNAMVDRAAAHRAGIGWYGKNANLLLPGRGSWFVLGGIVTDADLPVAEPVGDGCGPCTRCLSSCPTDAIVSPGVIDARRCLAWQLQSRGTFPRELREALGTRLYGCDDCQEVCPPNRVADRRPAAVAEPARRPWVPLVELLALDDDELLERYGLWYIADRDPAYLRRNALIGLGNAGDPSHPGVIDAIRHHLRQPNPMVRSHALWAARRLGLDHLAALVRDDASDEVRAEWAADVESGVPSPDRSAPAGHRSATEPGDDVRRRD